MTLLLTPPAGAKKIMVAMSGGVDSSVTAALLKNQGYEVAGVFMALAQPDLAAQVARVQKVADFLGISLAVVDLAAEFEAQVIRYFVESYRAGLTPNPCVVCNRHIKFGKLLEYAQGQGCDLLATGHYARIRRQPGDGYQLLKGEDPKKDQSYFLHQLSQAQLARVYFPLAGVCKEEVYRLAAELGVTTLHGAESQDVCFLQEQEVADFIANRLTTKPVGGAIVNRAGVKLGSHGGIHRYTVGQRRGLGIPDATPYYVLQLDAERNVVVVGKESELWSRTVVVPEIHWQAGAAPLLPQRYTVKVRYRHAGAWAEVEELPGGGVICRFSEPQRAVTPGQFAVLYEGDVVVGGGAIGCSCRMGGA